MLFNKAASETHPEDELGKAEAAVESADCAVETYAGKLRIRWDDSAAVRATGQIPVFIDVINRSSSAP